MDWDQNPYFLKGLLAWTGFRGTCSTLDVGFPPCSLVLPAMQNQSFEVLIPLHVEMRVAIQVRAVRVKCLVQICSMNCFIMFCQIILSKSFKQVPPPSSTWLWLKKWWHGPISYHPLRERISPTETTTNAKVPIYLLGLGSMAASFSSILVARNQRWVVLLRTGVNFEASQPAQEESEQGDGFLRAPRMEQEMYGCSLKKCNIRYIHIHIPTYIYTYMLCVCKYIYIYRYRMI